MKRRLVQFAALALSVLMIASLAACGEAANSSAQGGGAGEAGGGNATAGKEANTDSDEIVIGCVIPISGPLSAFGNGSDKMRDYAVQQINDAGGIEIDGKMKTIKMVYADSESDPTKASEAAAKLIQSDNIDLMVTSHTNDTTIPVAAACERAGIPCLSVDTPDDAWAAEGPYTYCFHAGFNTENELNSFKAAWDMVPDCNKKIGLLYANDVEGQELSGAIKEFATANGYEVVDPGSYTSGDTSFTSIINTIKGEECDIICGVMVTPDFKTFYNDLKRDGTYMPKICTVAKATLFADDVNAVGANGVGDKVVSEVWWTPNHPYSSSISGQTSKEIGDAWMEIVGMDYAPATAGYVYANMEIVYDVLSRAGTTSAEDIIAAAAETDFDSVIGHISYNEDHVSIQPLVTGQWRYVDGGWVQNIIDNTQVPDCPVSGELELLP